MHVRAQREAERRARRQAKEAKEKADAATNRRKDRAEAGKRHKLARRVVRQANSVGEAGPLAIAHDHKSEHANISVGEVLANGKTGL